ncbi:MAG: hypothetical protein NT069_26865 [Planctomycetota bacterium]|nr:hypothetical protein [Planctomycetota bacterium]
MRTTVTIPDQLFRLAKSRAALEGVPLHVLIEKGLTLVLACPTLAESRQRVEFPILRSKQPGSLSAAELLRLESQSQLDEDAQHAGLV